MSKNECSIENYQIMTPFTTEKKNLFKEISTSNKSENKYNHHFLDQIQASQSFMHEHSGSFDKFYQKSQSEISFDDDTSSTSGYKESYSINLVSIEGNCNYTENAPPLASPDLPSTNSTATNQITFDQSLPEFSMNSIDDGDKATLLTQSSQQSTSEFSLQIICQTQDENTLL